MEPNGLKYAGVDSCRKGWFLVSIDEHCLNFSFAIFGDIKTLWLTTQHCERIFIDIPIGLSNAGPRQCDVLARKTLKSPRGSSVFPAPSRAAVYAGSYEEASENNFKLTGKKISKQTWNISKKIREVDELLAELKNANGKIRESHPEICFWALAGGKPMDFPKKSNQGIKERLQLLQNHCQLSEAIFSEAQQEPRKDLAKDDILDALALAITAAAPVETLCTIPEIPERDDRNIAMEIVYTNRYLN